MDTMGAEVPINAPKEEIPDDNLVLLNTFFVKKKRYRVMFNASVLVWERENSKTDKASIHKSDIIAVKPVNVSNQNAFQLFYARRAHKNNANKWRTQKITFQCSDARIVNQWVDKLNQQISAIAHRPKRLLVFVNPYGGRKKALVYFEQYAKPLFELCNINVMLIVSQRPNQITDILLTQSLEQFDGIVCVGGDGTVSEVFNGLVYRTMNDLGLSTTHPKYIPEPKLPIGIIPAGSTSTVAFCLHGTIDIMTSVIHIVLGQTGGLDLATVIGRNGYMRLFASVMSYGYLGNIAKDSEKYRWMGPKRYDYSGFKKFFKNEGYVSDISILLDESSDPKAGPECYENCDRCSMQSSIKQRAAGSQEMLSDVHKEFCDSEDDLEEVPTSGSSSTMDGVGSKWKHIRGKFFIVTGANISCMCARSPNGFSKYCHLGDGAIDLILIRHTNYFNVLRLLVTMSQRNRNITSLPFVEIYRAKKFIFRTPKKATSEYSLSDSTHPIESVELESESVWNCDGEVIDETDVTVIANCQLVKVYKRGTYDPSKKESQKKRCCCCCKPELDE